MTSPRFDKNRPLAALLVPDLLELLEEAPESIGPQTEEMHPADLADIAEALPEDMVRAFLSALPKERAGEVLEYLDESLRTMVLEELTAVEAASIMSEMTPDERADALEELDEETADEILAEFEPEEKAETERLLEYDPYTAGGLMTTEFVSVDENLTAEEALVAVRAMSRAGRREAMYTVYTVDGNGRLRGVLSLRELLASPDGTPLERTRLERSRQRRARPAAGRGLADHVELRPGRAAGRGSLRSACWAWSRSTTSSTSFRKKAPKTRRSSVVWRRSKSPTCKSASGRTCASAVVGWPCWR